MKLAFNKTIRNKTKKALLVNYLIVFILLAIILQVSFTALGYNLAWEVVWKYRINFIKGFGMTVLLSFISLFASLLLGTVFGLAQRSKVVIFKTISRVYIEIIRGTPLLVHVLIFYYVIANAVGLNNRFIVGICIMSIFSGAYIAEIIRPGIESIGKSQIETAVSLGFTTRQIYRHIIFPQAITRILPPLTGQFAALIKDSSLLSVIAIKEFTMAAREINSATFSTLESYLPLAIGYLILTIPISLVTRSLEKKYKYET